MRFRLGLVGAGRMGRNHVKALRGSSLAEVVAVADPSDDARRGLDVPGISVHRDLESMLKAGGVDGLLVCVPTTLHLLTVERIIASRLPILAEKPLGLNSSEAGHIARVAGEANVPLQVGFWRRFVPMLSALRARIQVGDLGNIYSVCCYQWDGAPPSAYFRRNSGGILADMGVHDFEQIRWLTGQEFLTILAVAADSAQEPWPGDPESAHILAKLSGGATAAISLGRRFPLGDVCKVEVFGTKGAEECRFLWPPTADETFFEALRAQAESFVAYVGGAPQEGATALDAVAALMAADRAAETLGTAVLTAVAKSTGTAVDEPEKIQ
jgi:myo-inositol 2-dehydrogenase / D-chiro-inositol 1-dehydrogenase